MLMERLFSSGIMQMGSSRVDPGRQVGVFNPAFVSGLPALRAAELEKFRWMAGEWDYENQVPATRVSPAYTDVGWSRFSFDEKAGWISMVAPDGKETPNITFDPFSKQWIYLLIKGAYGILRSDGWEGETISFTCLMTMLGINTECGITLVRQDQDRFSFANEELDESGSWAYIDQWRFRRKS
jgi:hypothetical protein